MLVGLTMTGKSTNSNILAKTLTQLKKAQLLSARSRCRGGFSCGFYCSAVREDGSTDPAHQLTKIFFLNPKSPALGAETGRDERTKTRVGRVKGITIEELYGSFNENTGEWKAAPDPSA